MVIPIAYNILRNPKRWDDKVFHDRIEAWYWSALFSGIFRERQNENAILELKLLTKCLEADPDAANQIKNRQSKVLSVVGYSDRDTLLLKDQDSAISSDVSYAILQYVLSLGPTDFDPEDSSKLFAWQDVELEDHHIVPLAQASTLRASAAQLRSMGDDFILNSPLNRTLISKHANRAIGSKSPAQYWSELTADKPASHLLPGTSAVYNIAPGDKWEAQVRSFLEERFQRLHEKLQEELAILMSS